jgi:hypothetical protein
MNGRGKHDKKCTENESVTSLVSKEIGRKDALILVTVALKKIHEKKNEIRVNLQQMSNANSFRCSLLD